MVAFLLFITNSIQMDFNVLFNGILVLLSGALFYDIHQYVVRDFTQVGFFSFSHFNSLQVVENRPKNGLHSVCKVLLPAISYSFP